MAKKKNNSLKNLAKNLVMALILLLVISGLFGLFSNSSKSPQEISLSELAQAIEAGKVQKITVKQDRLEALFADGTQVISQKEAETSLIESLRNYGVSPEKIQTLDIKIASSPKATFWLGTALSALLPILLFGALLYFMLRSAQKGQMKALSFGQSSAKIYSEKDSKNRVTFKDVADLKEAKEELKEVVDFLKNPKKYINMGAKIPRGVLLVGPPGCGKTLLARAVAAEAGVPFFHISGSEFIELFVGVGASVTWDTPVLIRTKLGTKLVPIGKFVDQFYQEENRNGVIPVTGVKTLGYNPLKTNFWGASGRSQTKFFGHSAWQEVKGVYRHKVKEIYEIHYLGGKLKTTGDHSVFVRHRNFIKAKKVSQLNPGDLLVNLPFKVKAGFVPGIGTTHKVKAHIFSKELPVKELVVWEEKPKWQWAYEFALANRGVMYQYEIAETTGFHKETIGAWQRRDRLPRYATATRIPERVKVTQNLMKLFGLYTAEGKGYPGLQFTFGIKEKKVYTECIRLMKKVFHLKPKVEFTQDNSLRLYYHSAPLGRFFTKHCGNGSHNKHIPEFLWDMPKEYFLSYLQGYSQGDGYTTQQGKLSITSVSHQLIQELAWLCSMHGIQVGIREVENKPGRIIKKKPLPGGKYWNLIIGKTAHPFSNEKIESPNQFKKPKVQKIVKKPYNGYVYDLCGCENEAFFGGHKPTLLHNSRVRSAFQMAKKNAPSILFIDELDAIGRVRGAGLGGGHDEREQTLNQILTEMDGFDKETNCIVLSASVSGDTPVLIRKKGEVKLLPVNKVIDPYYKKHEGTAEKLVDDLEVLGFERKLRKNRPSKNTYFQESAFKKVGSVFRHKVKEIYEVEYIGGKIKTTGDHSLFVRTAKGLEKKAVSQLKPGEILVDLPYKVNRTTKDRREIRAHKFNSEFSLKLPIWKPLFGEFEPVRLAYQYALAHTDETSQTQLGKMLGFSQRTIGKWQQGICGPRVLSRNYYQHKDILPEEVKVTPALAKIFGYYVAEGYTRKELDFCLSVKEKKKIEEIRSLMKKLFNLEPSRMRLITPGAVNIVYYCKPLAKFFAFHCGKGAKNKHVPSFLFEAPKEYYLEFLKGYAAGDGYSNKHGGLELTSVSKRLIVELNWLSRMHGFKSFTTSYVAKAGTRIGPGKPLPSTQAYRLGFGKTQNPLNPQKGLASTGRAIIKSIKRLSYNGYVYDFCGCENEAFFGGETPVLLHNTNRPDILDPALLRPGRFDRKVVLDLPDIKARQAILKVHARGKPLARAISLKEIAERTPGFSGADLENLLNEAAILAAKKNRKVISKKDLLESIEKVMLGREKKSRVMSEKEKRISAFHEAGHALVAHLLPHTDPIRKISIVSRGLAGGYTLKVPEKDKYFYSQSEFLDELASLLGGYAAEKIVFGETTTGAANDLKNASSLARDIVTRYGMSASLGPVTFGEREELIFLGKELAQHRNYSEKTAFLIDKEIQTLLKTAYQKAKKILLDKKALLEKIAQTLIKKETLERAEFEKLVGRPKLAPATL